MIRTGVAITVKTSLRYSTVRPANVLVSFVLLFFLSLQTSNWEITAESIFFLSNFKLRNHCGKHLAIFSRYCCFGLSSINLKSLLNRREFTRISLLFFPRTLRQCNLSIREYLFQRCKWQPSIHLYLQHWFHFCVGR